MKVATLQHVPRSSCTRCSPLLAFVTEYLPLAFFVLVLVLSRRFLNSAGGMGNGQNNMDPFRRMQVRFERRARHKDVQ